jgi:plastocyanin domain-containing protein
VEAVLNAEGVQEVDLIITPGGYSPLRFSVKQGIPVKLTFRALGEVGCGNELNLPTADGNSTALQLSGPDDQEEVTFTPTIVGQYQFFCGHAMYRGLMVVHE